LIRERKKEALWPRDFVGRWFVVLLSGDADTATAPTSAAANRKSATQPSLKVPGT
jgi:hypothetical protein